MSFVGENMAWVTSCRRNVEHMRAYSKEFDMVVCQGLSGQSIGFLAAYELGVPLLILRKEGERTKRTPGALEGREMVEYFRQDHGRMPRVCFVDDCIAGGNTRQRCIDAVKDAGGIVNCESVHAGFYLYSDSRLMSFGLNPDDAKPPKPKPARKAPVRRRKVTA